MSWILFAAVVGAAAWVLLLGWKRLRAADRNRLAEETSERIAEDRTDAYAEAAGFTPSNPLRVTSAAAIEPRAESVGCPVCEGPLHVQEHEAGDELGEPMRRLALKCGTCGRHQTLYAVIEAHLPN